MMKKEEGEREVCVRVKEGKTCQVLTPTPPPEAQHSVRDPSAWHGHATRTGARLDHFQSGVSANRAALSSHVGVCVAIRFHLS